MTWEQFKCTSWSLEVLVMNFNAVLLCYSHGKRIYSSEVPLQVKEKTLLSFLVLLGDLGWLVCPNLGIIISFILPLFGELPLQTWYSGWWVDPDHLHVPLNSARMPIFASNCRRHICDLIGVLPGPHEAGLWPGGALNWHTWSCCTST